MKEFLRVMKALSDPTRVKILKILERRSMCVCELQTALGSAQSTTSKHLKILEDAGLAASHKDGLWVNYTLAEQREDGAWPLPRGPEVTAEHEGYSMIPLQTAFPLRGAHADVECAALAGLSKKLGVPTPELVDDARGVAVAADSAVVEADEALEVHDLRGEDRLAAVGALALAAAHPLARGGRDGDFERLHGRVDHGHVRDVDLGRRVDLRAGHHADRHRRPGRPARPAAPALLAGIALDFGKPLILEAA